MTSQHEQQTHLPAPLPSTRPAVASVGTRSGQALREEGAGKDDQLTEHEADLLKSALLKVAEQLKAQQQAAGAPAAAVPAAVVNPKRLAWASGTVAVALGALTLLSVAQAAQSYALLKQVRVGQVSAAAVVPAAAVPAASSGVPDMVGGC